MSDTEFEVYKRQMEHELKEILVLFEYKHLPENLQAVSKPFGELANQAVAVSELSQELLVGLRKLLESKDCIVRAAKLKSLKEKK